LPDNVENLVLQGTSDFQGYGNSAANSIYGNIGSNVIDGGAGADILVGGDGDDAFVFHAGEAHGDLIFDFSGNANELGDVLQFLGFGTALQGATFSQVGASNEWRIHSGLDGHDEIITIYANVPLHMSDYSFVG